MVAYFSDQIEEALGPGETEDEICRGFHIIIRICDCWTLRNGEWLNDQVGIEFVIIIYFMLPPLYRSLTFTLV